MSNDEQWQAKELDIDDHVILRTVGVSPVLSPLPDDAFPVYFEFIQPHTKEIAEVAAITDIETVAMFTALLYNYASLLKCSEKFQALVDQGMAKIRDAYPHD